MSDNKNCVAVRITTKTCGETFVNESDGRIFKEGCDYRVIFAERSENGITRSEMHLSRNGARLRRRGAVCSEMIFDSSSQTRAPYSTSGLSAEFALRTSKYDVFFSERCIVIDLEYSLCDEGGGGIGDFKLKIEISGK